MGRYLGCDDHHICEGLQKNFELDEGKKAMKGEKETEQGEKEAKEGETVAEKDETAAEDKDKEGDAMDVEEEEDQDKVKRRFYIPEIHIIFIYIDMRAINSHEVHKSDAC